MHTNILNILEIINYTYKNWEQTSLISNFFNETKNYHLLLQWWGHLGQLLCFSGTISGGKKILAQKKISSAGGSCQVACGSQ